MYSNEVIVNPTTYNKTYVYVTKDKTNFETNEIMNCSIANGLVDGSQHITAGSWKDNFNFAIKFEYEHSKTNSIASVN